MTAFGRVVACLVLAGFAAGWSAAVQAQQRGVIIELKESERADAPVVESVQLYQRSYALVIGNDAYRDPFWAPLNNAVADARAVADALSRHGFSVTLRTDLDSDALEEALERFFIEQGSDDEARLFVWFAGHGYTERGEGYLMPVDGPDPSDIVQFRRRALSLRRIGEYAREAEAQHVLAVFDSCFAGTVFEVQRNAPPAAITRATTRPVRQFITSGDAGQTVSDDGTFRRMFVEALDGRRRADANGDGYVTASELGLFLQQRVTNYTEGAQTPRHGKLRDPNWDQGDFVFALAGPARERQRPVAPAAAAPGIKIEDRDETLLALKNANVRAQPEATARRLATLDAGSRVPVTGKVKQRDWLRIALTGGGTGYVWAPLLGPEPQRTPQPAPQSTQPDATGSGAANGREDSAGFMPPAKEILPIEETWVTRATLGSVRGQRSSGGTKREACRAAEDNARFSQAEITQRCQSQVEIQTMGRGEVFSEFRNVQGRIVGNAECSCSYSSYRNEWRCTYVQDLACRAEARGGLFFKR